MMDYAGLFESMRTTVTLLATIVLVKYYVYLAAAPFYGARMALWRFSLKRRVKNGELPRRYRPKVSIIIPAWNEEVGILTTVNSVLNSDYNNIEIVVVNDGSTDGTHKKMREFLKKYEKRPIKGKRVVYFYKKNGGKGSALNKGVEESSGEIVLTMDADSAHERDAIGNLVKYFADPKVDAVVGNVKIKSGLSVVGLIQKFEYAFGFYFKRVHSLFNAEYIYGGACAAFRRSTTFDKIGYFDESNKTEDIEYSMRTKLHGLKSMYAEDVVTYTEGAGSLMGLYKQRLRWKKGRLDTFSVYKGLFLSKNSRHSKFLSWFVLPYAIIGEVQMFLEPIFVTLIVSYSVLSGDYLSLGLGALFIMFSFLAAFLFGDRKNSPLLVLAFPFFWILIYLLAIVEYFALIKSIELLQKNEDVVWQNWSRKGISIDNLATD